MNRNWNACIVGGLNCLIWSGCTLAVNGHSVSAPPEIPQASPVKLTQSSPWRVQQEVGLSTLQTPVIFKSNLCIVDSLRTRNIHHYNLCCEATLTRRTEKRRRRCVLDSPAPRCCFPGSTDRVALTSPHKCEDYMSTKPQPTTALVHVGGLLDISSHNNRR